MQVPQPRLERSGSTQLMMTNVEIWVGFCVPLVTETYGAWGPEAMACFSQLASRLSIRLQKPKSVILHELYGRLNTCLVRCVATAITSRIQSS